MPQYMDASVEWGVERCYRLRAVEVAEALVLESEPGPSACVTPRDTFPPAPPVALETGPSEGAISLVWDAGKEKDVAAFLMQGLQMADQEPTTPLWFALRLGPTTFGVFDAFDDEAGRRVAYTRSEALREK